MVSITTRVALAAAASGVIGVPTRAALMKLGLFDVPNHRSSHTSLTPRGGGLAPLGAAAAVGLLGPRLSSHSARVVLCLAGVGFADDVSGHVPTLIRLGSQLMAGAYLAPSVHIVLSAIGTAGIVNVVNFMDGINGISGGVAVVWGLNALAMTRASDDDLAILGSLVLGAAAGFLPHNVPRARFFMGDVGSYGLGAAMAAGVFSQPHLCDRWRVASPLFLYGLDAGQAIVHRARTGQAIGVAHRDHVYQRLVDSGLSHTQVALFHSSLAATVAAAHRLPTRWTAPITAAASLVYLSAPALRARFRRTLVTSKVAQ